MESQTFATIAICTHNRPADVRRCLEGLVSQAKAQNIPILIVDSGSDASSARELTALAEGWDLQILRCDEPGLSVARNAALACVNAEWIVYLDDDAVPAPNWAEKLVECLADCSSEVGIVGGMIRPKWPEECNPEIITERWKLLLSCTDAPGHGRVPEEYNICGANLAVRRSALVFAGGFLTNLGRVGTRLISGEEAYLIAWLKRHGIAVVYDDRFVVDHYISKERMEPRWAAKRAYWEGYSYLRILKALGTKPPFSIWPLKLVLSIPPLALLSLVGIDYRIRLGMALGSLAAQIKE